MTDLKYLPPREPLVDPRTGIMTPLWYRLIGSLFGREGMDDGGLSIAAPVAGVDAFVDDLGALQLDFGARPLPGDVQDAVPELMVPAVPDADPSEPFTPSPPVDGLPPGGEAGQVLRKVSGTDYDAEWTPGGPGGLVLSDTITLTLINGYSLFGAGTHAELTATKIGRLVSIVGMIKGPNATVFANLPAGWRPVLNNHYVAQAGNGLASCDIDVSGDLNASAFAGGDTTVYVAVNAHFIVSAADAYNG